MRRVTLLACGGTIAGHADAVGHFRPTGHAAELLAGVRLPVGIEVTTTDALTVPSRAMSLANVLQLVERVEALAAGAQPPDGVVISQGTDTLEETA
ncbi:asparaginase domain-containing protein [Rhodanobacter denitrificans]|uniref:L-asparaginase/GlutRNAGln amidotransferase subunit D n=1 Tax=Rhodanobacter denitrificans TaxID=666685 RepID=I4WWV2_9GAMM|nr:asparaginase domain-containing protein [Rhodanobacter denitrificans]AGG89558.1 L-asparaginase/GlutRNAGln amidotransferase subunit D [Rhodanobacter denitrificans]EIM03944.1 L-asparaginase [Rhodanobacter denitrificans]UJJ58052.1 asparaginase domain-containing protein [Rhodanobacter denitrificans]UJM88436.1 asparaginase domain-containing protein [Rhodanobacter denitrificans]UJM91929.1 asparaginase domain-containing protein [Rhodanobacter denitrificans]